MRHTTDGHRGLENEVRREETVGDFKLALSYLKETETTAYFVVHAWSNKFHSGPSLQRSNAAPTRDKTFLDRLGFEYSDSCNVLDRGECHYMILDKVDRPGARRGMPNIGGGSNANKRFDLLVENLQEIYDQMHDVDKKLQRAGFGLPWDSLEQAHLDVTEKEAVYEGSQVYDFYKDFGEKLSEAQSELFVIDSYVDEELLELYVDKLDDYVNIRILTKNPKGKFEEVAQKFAQQRGGGFEVRTNPDCHDRLFFVDRNCYVLGQSIKDAARKPTYMVEIESFDDFKNNFEALWDGGDYLI